jgi:hypothetical protein
MLSVQDLRITQGAATDKRKIREYRNSRIFPLADAMLIVLFPQKRFFGEIISDGAF